jgi:AraC-like DNA-binding protein
MPLFMEFHKAVNPSIEDLKKRAGSGYEILQQFNVRYHQFWINEEAGTVFCLIEGPSQNICESVHRSLYGNGLYSLQAVKECLPSENPLQRSSDISKTTSASGENGYFVVLRINMLEKDSDRTVSRIMFKPMVRSIVEEYSGIEVTRTDTDSFVAYFSKADDALLSSSHIQKSFLLVHQFTGFRMAVVPNNIRRLTMDLMPVSHGIHLCQIAQDSSVIVSFDLSDRLGQMDFGFSEVQALTLNDQKFINQLQTIAGKHLSDEHFNVEALSKYMGISRPQLYRKVHAVTGRSPNIFIRDLRMERALSLLHFRSKNISEVALEVGYTNPSYFARTFSSKYGCTPSRFLTADSETV